MQQLQQLIVLIVLQLQVTQQLLVREVHQQQLLKLTMRQLAHQQQVLKLQMQVTRLQRLQVQLQMHKALKMKQKHGRKKQTVKQLQVKVIHLKHGQLAVQV